MGGGCCRSGWNDGADCAFGHVGCAGTHCCVLLGSVPAPPPPPPAPLLPDPSPPPPPPPSPPPISPPLVLEINFAQLSSAPLTFADGGSCRYLYLSSLLDIAANEATRQRTQRVFLSVAASDGATVSFDASLLAPSAQALFVIGESLVSCRLDDLIRFYGSLRLRFCPACTERYYRLTAYATTSPAMPLRLWAGQTLTSLVAEAHAPAGNGGTATSARIEMPLARVFASNTHRALLRGFIYPSSSSASSLVASPPSPPPPSPTDTYCDAVGCTALVWNTPASGGAGTCGEQIARVQQVEEGHSERNDACRFVARLAEAPECAPCESPPQSYCGVAACTYEVWTARASNGHGTCGAQIEWAQAHVPGYADRTDACRYVAQQASAPECAPCDSSPKPTGCGRDAANLSATVSAEIVYTALGRQCTHSYVAAAASTGEYSLEVSVPSGAAAAAGGPSITLTYDARLADAASDGAVCTWCDRVLRGTFSTDATVGRPYGVSVVLDGDCLVAGAGTCCGSNTHRASHSTCMAIRACCSGDCGNQSVLLWWLRDSRVALNAQVVRSPTRGGHAPEL